MPLRFMTYRDIIILDYIMEEYFSKEAEEHFRQNLEEVSHKYFQQKENINSSG